MSESKLIEKALRLDHKEKNYNEAFKYYLLAAKKGNDVALNNLGYMYELGKGVKQDYQKSLYYYNKASLLDKDGVSLHNLSRLYLNGLGVEKSKEKALFFLKKSADLGNKQAMNDLYWLTKSDSESEHK
ncbi:tetratricopeptide repeat protein [Xenorhabdus littoralis]|nr:tetratricopeptide repeat protein [Xenorhabdus sp. Reich]